MNKLVYMHAVSVNAQAFSLEWQDILYLLLLVLSAKLGQWQKVHGICYRISEKCTYEDMFD